MFNLYRSFNTDKNGNSFSNQQRSQVWEKAIPIPGYDKNVVRKDTCGAFIKWADYGKTSSDFGWEIDHIYPASLGGSDLLSNLQPLHWRNNREKSDAISGNYCLVKAV